MCMHIFLPNVDVNHANLFPILSKGEMGRIVGGQDGFRGIRTHIEERNSTSNTFRNDCDGRTVMSKIAEVN